MIATISERELYVPDGHAFHESSVKMSNALAIELLNYGILCDEAIVNRLCRQTPEAATRICHSILKMYTIGDVNTPLFDQWERRTEFLFEERCVQILGYMFQFSSKDLANPDYLRKLKANVDFSRIQTLKLASSKRAENRFRRLVTSEVALGQESQRDLAALAQVYHAVAPQQIHSAEGRIAVLMGMVASGMTVATALKQLQCNAMDVLRYAAGKVSFESLKLPADVMYAKLPWRERVQLLSFLSEIEFDDLCESMGNNRTAWFRFIRHVHLLQQPDFRNRFPSVVAAACVSIQSKMDSVPEGRVRKYIDDKSSFIDLTDAGNLVFRTFASRIQSAVDRQDFDALRSEIVRQPSYLLRNIGSLSHVCTSETQEAFVDLVKENVAHANAGVLFSIIQINVNAEFRIIDSKGNTTVTEANYSPVIAKVQAVAEHEIHRRFGFDGKVLVDNELKSRIVPFLSTNAELDRGTRIPFQKSAYLYFLIHWVQKANRRTDLDHSYVCFDKDWNSETIYFGNQANSFIKQSGDITNAPAPEGGTEYGRIDLHRIPKHVRYIVPIVNVYCGDVFSENESAYAGFQFSDSDHFALSREHTRYDLNQPANSNVPFVIDVQSREIVIVDFNNRQQNGLTAHSSIDEIRKVISALKTKRFVTIQRFAELLSGDQSSTALRIRRKSRNKSECSPENLQSLIQASHLKQDGIDSDS